jgi:hypothetical protein
MALLQAYVTAYCDDSTKVDVITYCFGDYKQPAISLVSLQSLITSYVESGDVYYLSNDEK